MNRIVWSRQWAGVRREARTSRIWEVCLTRTLANCPDSLDIHFLWPLRLPSPTSVWTLATILGDKCAQVGRFSHIWNSNVHHLFAYSFSCFSMSKQSRERRILGALYNYNIFPLTQKKKNFKKAIICYAVVKKTKNSSVSPCCRWVRKVKHSPYSSWTWYLNFSSQAWPA